MKTKDFVIQLCLALLGTGAFVMSFSQDPVLQKWAPVVGLAGQPFWFYLSIRLRLWGVLFSTVIYTLGFAYGIDRFWFGFLKL